jgi:SAM-dependent methyltransferase
VDFYRDVFAARSVTAVELVPDVCVTLRSRYRGQPVEVLNADVSAQEFNPGRFDIINAIGVMFHIIDDAAWRRAIGNLARSLAPGGTLIVGGQFGWLTRSVLFHHTDRYASWAEAHKADGKEVLVNKRIRSLRAWRRTMAAAGLRVAGVVRTPAVRGIATCENNILAARAREGS